MLGAQGQHLFLGQVAARLGNNNQMNPDGHEQQAKAEAKNSPGTGIGRNRRKHHREGERAADIDRRGDKMDKTAHGSRLFRRL